jgi:radical SAM superfamily enzyme YgiQ (UPF0313 family)
MMAAGRRVALLSIATEIEQHDDPTADETRKTLNRFPSYGVRRVEAALRHDPRLQDADVLLHDGKRSTAEELLELLEDFRPDVVGLAAYVWSTATMVELARGLKERHPEVTVVFGGPSARKEMFDLPPFARPFDYLDALVLGEGEETFAEVVLLAGRDRDALASIPGLAVPRPDGTWITAPPRVANDDMDTVASPYQSGLMPHGHVAYLETFRGCPLSCSFCQWGVMEAKRFFSYDYLVKELTALKNARPLYTFIIDAALNLHPRAFRNLAAAEREVGFFRDSMLLSEVYPAYLRDEHLEFLASAGAVHCGVGVQSLESEALKANQRPFRPEHLRGVIDQLLRFGPVDLEIILGLPGDTPEGFRRTLHALLELPCSVRVYRCLVLPDALMSRAPAGADLRFDPLTLLLESCSTWPAAALRETWDYVDRLAAHHPTGAVAGKYWWLFTGSAERYRSAYPNLGRQAQDTGRETPLSRLP